MVQFGRIEPFYMKINMRRDKIKVPTLVIGGEKDITLGGDASKEIAGIIPGAELRMYEQWGHGLCEEAKDFNAFCGGAQSFLCCDDQNEESSLHCNPET